MTIESNANGATENSMRRLAKDICHSVRINTKKT